MVNMYRYLLSPFKLGNHTFKNRILCGPLGYNEENPGAPLIMPNIDYYSSLARGGCARVTTGDTMVSTTAGYNGGSGRVKFFCEPLTGEFMNSIKTYVHSIHQYDCLAFVQFGHNGAASFSTEPGQKTYGPSGRVFDNGSEVIEMDLAMMQEVCTHFHKCVARAREFGVDGCIIHGGHGAKILDQFRSAYTNHRADEFGGSVVNRCKFPMMLMRAVREAAAKDFIVELRISADEYVKGGITVDETIEFLKMVEAEGLADIFHITGGMHIAPRHNAYCISPGTFPPAMFRDNCRAIKDAGIRTPIAIVNSCADPDIAEDIIASGDADFIVLSRQINLADPYYPRKLREGRPELIDGCLRCHGCYDMVGPCSVNPLASYKTYESSYELAPANKSRKVCVVGGGIAGLKAAFTAAERGHKVILFEKESSLGGQLRFADSDTLKVDIKRYINNMIKRCKMHENLRIRLGIEVTPEIIEAEKPYALIVAIGAEQKLPDIPGINGPNVLSILDCYLKPELLGKSIVMLGSGITACEVGLHLERTGKKVSIVGRREGICFHENFKYPPTSVYSPIPTFLDWFTERGIDLYDNSECIEIMTDGVQIKNVITGKESIIKTDNVVIAAGMKAKREEALEFNSTSAGYFAMVGDCITPAKIRDAVSTGYHAAYQI